MIIDNISEITKYKSLLPRLDEALVAIKDASTLEVGKYEFEHFYFMIQEGITKPLEEGGYEAHRNYIDVQILLDGKEEIAWKKYSDLQVSKEYDPVIDKELLQGSKENHMLIEKGMFWVAFPWDGHKAISHIDTPYNYRKIVLKLPVKE